MFETFCIDISVNSAIVLSEATKPLSMYKVREYVIMVYPKQILIFKLHKDQLVLDNKIRLTGPTYVIMPYFSQNSIFIILKNKLLVKYNLYSKQQLILQIMQYDGNIQFDEVKIMNYGVLKQYLIINLINTANLVVTTYQNNMTLDVESGMIRIKTLLKKLNILYNNRQLQLFQLQKGEGSNPGHINYIGEVVQLKEEETISDIIEYQRKVVVVTDLNVYIMAPSNLSVQQIIPYINKQRPYILENRLILQNEIQILQLYKNNTKDTKLLFKITKTENHELPTTFVLNASLHETYNMTQRVLTHLTMNTERKFTPEVVLYDEPSVSGESQTSVSTATTAQFEMSMDDAAQCKTIDTVFKAVIHGDEVIEQYMHQIEPAYETSSSEDRCENSSNEPADGETNVQKKQSLQLQLMNHKQSNTKLNILIDTHNTHSIVLDHVKILTFDNNSQMYQISPTVCMYNYHLKQLIFYDVIRFKTLVIDTEPITQFCMSCTKSIHFLAYSTYDQTLNISTVTILTIHDFHVENVLETYEVYGYVRSICVQHDSFTVCTIVTFDNFIEVHRIEQGRSYSFKCSFPICCAFELLQEGNLYVLDENRNGHFISVPNQLNQQFCLINQTNIHIFQQFEYMLTIYMSQFKQDGTFAEPIVLPMDTDVEARCFQRNLAKAFCEVIDDLRENYPTTLETTETLDEASQHQQQLDAQRAEVTAYIEETSRDVRSYYISHRASFEINVFNLLQRLSWYLNQMLLAIELKTGKISTLRSSKSSLDIKQSIDASFQPVVQLEMQRQKRYEDAVAGAESIQEIKFPTPEAVESMQRASESGLSSCKTSAGPSDACKTGCVPQAEDVSCVPAEGIPPRQSISGISNISPGSPEQLRTSPSGTTLSPGPAKAIEAHCDRLGQPNYEQLRAKLRTYSEFDIVSHSAYQTLRYTKLELSDCLSYNFLHIYFQHRKFPASPVVQHVLSNMARRILPFIMKTTLPRHHSNSTCIMGDQSCLSDQNSYIGSNQTVPASVRVRNFLKKMFGLGDVGDIYLSTDIEHQCYTSQHSSLFTLGFITLFTLFINLDRVDEFLGVKINSGTFKMLESLLQEYLTKQKRFICVRSILDHVSSQEPGPRYSALMLLRLYKMQMCKFWVQNSDSEDSDTSNLSIQHQKKSIDSNSIFLHAIPEDTETEEAHNHHSHDEKKTWYDPMCVFDYLRVMNVEIGRIYRGQVNNSTFDDMPAAVVAVESLVQPLHIVLISGKCIDEAQMHVISTSLQLFNVAMHKIKTLVGRMDEAKVDSWTEDERLYKYAVLLIHCITFNLFYVNSVYLYQETHASGQKNPLCSSNQQGCICHQSGARGKFITPAKQIRELLDVLLKFSGLLRLMPMRSFVYEQLIQFCVKSEEPQLIATTVTSLLAEHRFGFAYKSIAGFLHYARYNYKAVLERWGGHIVQVLLNLASQYFKKLVHDAAAKPMLQLLLQMLLNLCKGCDCLNYFTFEQRQHLVFTLEGRLCMFDFHNYVLTQYQLQGYDNLQLELVKHARLDQKVLMIAVSLQQNLLILSNSLFDAKKFIILPAIPSMGSAQQLASQKDLKLQVTRLTQEFVHQHDIFVTIEIINGQLIVNLTNTQIFSLTCYKLINTNYTAKRTPPQAGKFGMYKFKKNVLSYSSPSSKTKFISLSMDRDSVKYIVKW